MILEIKTGRKRNGGLKRIKHTRKSPLSVPHKKNEPPMRGSSALPEFVPKTKGIRFGAMILELKTGRKRNKGSKRIGIRGTQQLSVPNKKNEPPMRGSSSLPEFVLPKPKLPRFGAMILEIKTGRKRNKGSKRIEHTRESLLSRSNSFLAQKHSPNQMRFSFTLDASRPTRSRR